MTLYHSPRRPPGVGACWSCRHYTIDGCAVGRHGWPEIGRRCMPSGMRQGYEYEPGSDEIVARERLLGREDDD